MRKGSVWTPDGRLSNFRSSLAGSLLTAMKALHGVSGPPGGLTSTISDPAIQLIRPLIATTTAPAGSSSISASPLAEERSS